MSGLLTSYSNIYCNTLNLHPRTNACNPICALTFPSSNFDPNNWTTENHIVGLLALYPPCSLPSLTELLTIADSNSGRGK